MTRFARGATVGGYRIEGDLGEGGMGIVYRAVQLSLGREVALKVLNPGIAADPEVRKRFIQEGVLAARVTHGRLVRVLEVGEQQGRLFLAYELVDGVTLRQKLDREGPMAPEEAVELAIACADVLAALHRSGVLHRDLKPANIFVSPTRGPLVGDLGIAKDLLGASVRTSHGMLLGTPGYMAPEFLEGRPASAASDIYALGVVFFECLSGRKPFEAKDPLELMRIQGSTTPPDICRLRPDVGVEYRRLIEKALSKEPGKRHPSAEVLKRELEALPPAEAGALPAPRGRSDTIRVSSADLPRASRPIEDTFVSRPSPIPRRSRSLVPVLAVLGILVLGAGAALTLREAPPAPAPPAPPAVVAPPEPDLGPRVRAVEEALTRAWQDAWKLQVFYEKQPERIDPSKAADEIGAIVKNMFTPCSQMIDTAARLAPSQREEAARTCGLMLCRMLASAMRCRSSLWGIFSSFNERMENKRHSGYIADAVMPTYEYRYATHVAQTSLLLLANIPADLRRLDVPAWHAGLACLHALCREGAKDPKASRRAYEATVAAVNKAWDALVFAPRPSEADIELVEALLQALDHAGARPSHASVIKRSRDRLAGLTSRSPGQELMRHLIQWKTIEVDIQKDILDVNADDTYKPRFPLYLAERDTFLRNWPYDLTKPPPASPTPAQAEAVVLDARARQLLDRIRMHVKSGAEHAGKPVPPEPTR